MENEFKFEVATSVRLTYKKNTRVFIVERSIQECPAGIQKHYIGRVHYSGKYGGINDKNLTSFNEVELEAIPEPSPKLQELITKRDALNLEKITLIKQQDFEKASAIRDEERKLNLEIELLQGQEEV